MTCIIEIDKTGIRLGRCSIGMYTLGNRVRATFTFTARCYACAVLAMGLCPCLFVTSRCSVEVAGRIGLSMGASFDQSYTVF